MTIHRNGRLFNLLSPPSPSCVLYLPGQDDAYATTIKDQSGFSNHGTISGGVWARLASGIYALDVDNVDDVVTIPHTASFNITSQITLMVWAKITDTIDANEYPLLGKDMDRWQLSIYSEALPKIYFYIHNSSTNSSITFTKNVWHLFTGVYDHVNLTAYRDITAATPTAYSGDLGVTSNSVLFGKLTGGLVALPRIFTYALALSQITSIFNQERSLFGV